MVVTTESCLQTQQSKRPKAHRLKTGVKLQSTIIQITETLMIGSGSACSFCREQQQQPQLSVNNWLML